MKDGKDNGKSPTAVKPPEEPATIATKDADIRAKRPRAPRPQGSPITVQKKGIG